MIDFFEKALQKAKKNKLQYIAQWNVAFDNVFRYEDTSDWWFYDHDYDIRGPFKTEDLAVDAFGVYLEKGELEC